MCLFPRFSPRRNLCLMPAPIAGSSKSGASSPTFNGDIRIPQKNVDCTPPRLTLSNAQRHGKLMFMPAVDPTQRFSARVDNYIRYRPGYPPEALEGMRRECGLKPTSVIADIGSGTGLLAKLFLENGNPVFGLAPNK